MVMIPAETLMMVDNEHRARLMAANDAGMRLRRIERDMREIEAELREQAIGSQDGYLLDIANRIRAVMAGTST